MVGSTGQPKAHPLLEEARRRRALLDKLTTSLGLPEESQRPRPDPRFAVSASEVAL